MTPPTSLTSLLPDDLTGRTVLDVGCGLGEVAREANRRNADHVVGVDIDDSILEAARTGGGGPPDDPPIEYRWADLESWLPDGPFDHVVCHNLLHRVRNPIDVLDRLIDRVETSLIMNITGPASERPARLLRRDYGATPQLGTWVAEAPLAVVGRNGTPGRKREQKFFFSPEAMRNLLMEQRRYFARLDVRAAEADGRFTLRAERRTVGRLVIVSGPTGAGKSTLLDAIQAGAGRCLADQPWGGIRPVDGATWPVANSDRLPMLGANVPELLFHYDLLRPWRRDAAIHERDEGLHVIDCSAEVEVLVLVAPAPVLAARLSRELEGVDDQDSRQARRLREVIQLYADPDQLVRQVARWERFCQDRGARVAFVDSNGPLRPLAGGEWADTIREEQPS